MAADGFITDLKRKFQQGDIVLRLVYVNVAVFLVVTLVQIFLTLFNVPASPWMNYLETLDPDYLHVHACRCAAHLI